MPPKSAAVSQSMHLTQLKQYCTKVVLRKLGFLNAFFFLASAQTARQSLVLFGGVRYVAVLNLGHWVAL
jgi:hypothetical protein